MSQAVSKFAFLQGMLVLVLSLNHEERLWELKAPLSSTPLRPPVLTQPVFRGLPLVSFDHHTKDSFDIHIIAAVSASMDYSQQKSVQSSWFIPKKLY